MNPEQTAEIRSWVTEAGLAGTSEAELLHGFCERASAAGLPLARGIAVVDTLHPVYQGRVFRWYRGREDLSAGSEYGRPGESGQSEDAWRQSPWYYLVDSGGSML